MSAGLASQADPSVAELEEGFDHGTETGGPDTHFTKPEYAAMLDEVRNYLPAFLSPAASEHHDPVGDVKELLRLRDIDLDRLVAVHVCLSDEVTDFVAALDRGLRRPMTATERPEEVTQAVRGPIDWGATIRRRSLSGFDPSLFVVRPGQRIFDTPENQTLAWAIATISVALRKALGSEYEVDFDDTASGWTERLIATMAVLHRARRIEWFRNVPARRPTSRVLQRIAASRSRFYRHDLANAVRALLVVERRDETTLTEVLSQRYFRPEKEWRLFEVVVALRLAREFAKPEYSLGLRRTRLLAGAGGPGAYARYELAAGGTVSLTYQGWPAASGESQRQVTAKRHGFFPKSSIPDLFVERRDGAGHLVDALVLELKATKSPGYLGDGLSQLLGYLGERPSLFGKRPAGWLVAPPSDAFHSAGPSADAPLWIVRADEVAPRAATRMTSDDV